MLNNQFQLLKTKRFLPLFITQLLGALNDNIFKNAFVILITYRIASQSQKSVELMVGVAFIVFVLPFFLFSAPAGQLADKLNKTKLIRLVKCLELLICLVAILGFYQHSSIILMACLFLLGLQSAFFGPLKYAILPFHLAEDEIVGGTALIETATFIAILIGTVLGTQLILIHHGLAVITSLLIGVAVLGLVASFFIPNAKAITPDLPFNPNFLRETLNIIKHVKTNKQVFLAILGVSWFWLIGAVVISQLSSYVKFIVGGDNSVVTLFLLLLSIGIAIGSLLCNKLLKGKISAKYVPVSVLAISIFLIDFYFASQTLPPVKSGTLIGITSFLKHFVGWRLLIDFSLVAFLGGLYSVPLYAIMQTRCEAEHRARTIACNNILNALGMVVGALACAVLLKLHLSTLPGLILVLGCFNLLVGLYICKILPFAVMQSILRWMLVTFYRVNVTGIENFEKAGKRVLIIANHTSFLDAVIISAFLNDKLTFVVNSNIAKIWWMKLILPFFNAFIVDPTSPMATKSVINELKKDIPVVIFPEGRITVTGALMKVYEGPALIADKTNAMVLPIRIKGAQYTPFSRLRGKVRIQWFPPLGLTILPPRKFDVDPNIKGRKRRHMIGSMLYDMMTIMMFESSNLDKNLFKALLEAKKIHGGKHVIMDDIQRMPLNYNQVITRSFILGKYLANHSQPHETLGIMLPSMTTTILTFFAMQLHGRIPAMLNFSAGANNILQACRTACIKTVYTSKKFVDTANLQDVIDRLISENITVVFLESLKNQIGILQKLSGLLASKFAHFNFKRFNPDFSSNDTAVILFTSGSEGAPKGVALSHRNLQANRYQLCACIDLNSQDIVFNALPVFHSFGLTAGAMLSTLYGLKTFFYPSPLHYRIVPELVYDTNATIMFGTDTFLAGYAKYAHPYDFYSIRYVFAGAEKVKNETRKVWSEKFGLRLLEGYGATETAPILAVNTPMQNKPGSVGRFLPGIEYKLEPVAGIETGGRLWVKGPNIMKGYLLADNPGQLVPPPDGWYDTGDIVDVDKDQFVFIKGRAKRFAKIGGEMVSLTAVEMHASQVWPEHLCAAISLPDVKKGEKIILATECPDANRDELRAYYKEHGIGEINLPRDIVVVKKVPVLGTGKVDYVSLKTLFEK